MKLIGVLLVINSIAVSFWWIRTDNTHRVTVLTLCFLAVFAGLALVLGDRITELTVKGVGTIKAAVQQAKIDADEIKKIKKRVESQSATVDLVAESAAKAHNLIEDLSLKNQTAETKIEELKSLGVLIQKTTLELQERAVLTSLIASAQNDDRVAFDKLAILGGKKTFKYWQHAADTVVKIRISFGGPIEPGYLNFPWLTGTDPTQLTLARFKQEYKKAIRIYKVSLVQAVWKNSVIGKKDKMSFFVDILKDDDSLIATFYAGQFFVRAAEDSGLKWSPFVAKPLLDWWAEHAESIDPQVGRVLKNGR